MNSIIINCILSGNNFIPSKLEKLSTLKLISKFEKGELGKIGRYRGKELPYSCADIDFEVNTDLDSVLTHLTNNYCHMKESGVEEIYLTMNLGFRDQCNWEFDNEQLKKIIELGIKFSLTCYKLD